MTGRQKVFKRVPFFALFLACGSGRCGSSTEPCPPQGRIYAVRITSAPTTLGAVVISIAGGGAKTVTLSGGPRSMLGPPLGDAYRAIVMTPTSQGDIARIELVDTNSGAPSVTVLDAAAGVSGGYEVLGASAVRVAVLDQGPPR
jgi:hypothetical protein